MVEEVILIGSMAAGKSIVGQHLAAKLKKPQRSLDSTYAKYRKEWNPNYDEEGLRRLRAEDIAAWREYREPFNLFVVEKELSMYRGSVFDFGAYHSVYSIPENANRIKLILEPYRNVILLLPTKEVEQSRDILLQRKNNDYPVANEPEFLRDNDYFLNHRLNYELANHIIYTHPKTPEEICDEILQIMS